MEFIDEGLLFSEVSDMIICRIKYSNLPDDSAEDFIDPVYEGVEKLIKELKEYKPVV